MLSIHRLESRMNYHASFFIRNLQSIELHLVSAILLAINLSNFMAKLNLCPESSEFEFACYRAFFIRKKIAPLYMIIRRGNSSNPRKADRTKKNEYEKRKGQNTPATRPTVVFDLDHGKVHVPVCGKGKVWSSVSYRV